MHLYKNFLEDKNIYNKNVKYWDNIISNLLISEKFDFNQYISTDDGFGNLFYDGNPIYKTIVGADILIKIKFFAY